MRFGLGRLVLRSKVMSCSQRRMQVVGVRILLLGLLIPPGAGLLAQNAAGIVFTQSATQVGVFDFVEVTAKLPAAAAPNPFTDASITGDFEQAGSASQDQVEGFCDSTDGTVYRIRFMPSKSGTYTFHVSFKSASAAQDYSGTFNAIDHHR